ncbi:hypothetical protein V6N13_067317 [Hibiscus sabdariffa]|uniref:Uncharacterized protein n=2 Tax=Hibiscus sabdariffa TaxID=183260 RepID=A0ABR1Z9I2_9ROSI
MFPVSTESYMAAYSFFMGDEVLQSVQWKDSAGEEATVQSRHKTTRFQGDNWQNNRGWRNPRGGRGQTLHMTNRQCDTVEFSEFCCWAN